MSFCRFDVTYLWQKANMVVLDILWYVCNVCFVHLLMVNSDLQYFLKIVVILFARYHQATNPDDFCHGFSCMPFVRSTSLIHGKKQVWWYLAKSMANLCSRNGDNNVTPKGAYLAPTSYFGSALGDT